MTLREWEVVWAVAKEVQEDVKAKEVQEDAMAKEVQEDAMAKERMV